MTNTTSEQIRKQILSLLSQGMEEVVNIIDSNGDEGGSARVSGTLGAE